MQKINSSRIASIDIFRALTMFLMIFVNDFWTLSDIPEWMKHTKVNEDGMGLSDWVFPGFLFIVGLSIPFAIDARKKKGETTPMILWHIAKRSFALIVMGFFMVNLENITSDLLPISKYIWQLLMATAIVLVWNIYPNHKAFKIIPEWAMQLLGVVILIFLSVIYKSGTVENPGWMQPHWWGILGIIGWAYLLCASLYVFIGKRILLIGLLLLVFHMMNAFDFVQPFGLNLSLNLMVSASNHASVVSGLLATLLYMKYGKSGNSAKFLAFIFLLAAVSLVYGFATRPVWGISKILATPSWTTICAGISFAAFGILYIISDVLHKTSWANFIKPAGQSTLTCYLMPYFYYAIMAMIGVYLPEILKTGVIGLLKSLLFAWLIIFITGQLGKLNIKLKV